MRFAFVIIRLVSRAKPSAELSLPRSKPYNDRRVAFRNTVLVRVSFIHRVIRPVYMPRDGDRWRRRRAARALSIVASFGSRPHFLLLHRCLCCVARGAMSESDDPDIIAARVFAVHRTVLPRYARQLTTRTPSTRHQSGNRNPGIQIRDPGPESGNPDSRAGYSDTTTTTSTSTVASARPGPLHAPRPHVTIHPPPQTSSRLLSENLHTRRRH